MLICCLPSKNAVDLATINSLELYLISFRAGKVLKGCMNLLFLVLKFLNHQFIFLVELHIIYLFINFWLWQGNAREWVEWSNSFWNFISKKPHRPVSKMFLIVVCRALTLQIDGMTGVPDTNLTPTYVVTFDIFNVFKLLRVSACHCMYHVWCSCLCQWFIVCGHRVRIQIFSNWISPCYVMQENKWLERIRFSFSAT